MYKAILKLLEKQGCVSVAAQEWQHSDTAVINLTGLTETVKTGFLCALKEKLHAAGPLVILTANRDDIRVLRREAAYFYPQVPLLELYPASLLKAQVDTKNEEVLAERVAALETLLEGKSGVVFVTSEALLQKLPVPDSIVASKLKLQVGATLEREELVATLVERGYERVEQVETLGQFCLRGEILDIFPINAQDPVRVEWFDNTIDAMRSFALTDQRSLATLQETEIVPITWQQENRQVSLFDYLAPTTLLAMNEPVRFFTEIEQIYSYSREEHEDELFTPQALETLSGGHRLVTLSVLTHNYFPQAKQLSVAVSTIAPYNKDTDLLLSDLRGYLQDGIRPLIMMSSAEKAAGLAQSLQQSGLQIKYVKGTSLAKAGGSVFVGELSSGFRFWDEKWLLLSEGDIFGVQKKRRLIKRKEAGAKINYFSEIKTGDYVVHNVHGIGRYAGVETILVDGVHRDYLRIQYAKDDRLFLPIEQVTMLHKYIGGEGTAPKLSRMGGSDWQRVTKRAKAAITLMATELLRLYAQRKIAQGHAFSPDTQWQKDFEDSFPFEETPDQLQAIREIKADMEKPVPMERLLCGDVGYGKTEVAIRAAFKAVMDGKQVAVLAPTTVLAQQHLLTFSQRMGSFGVRVEMVSRFRTTAEQKKVLEKLEAGQVDVLIGTHRLLQPDVTFKDLGLLIIDEEQRFGVGQKEKIKRWTKGVDVLTLSATPIPRTLHMALVKGKDMSIIESPPEDRLPVETYVAEYNDDMIKEAIEREIKRGGRIYYVHNRVGELDRIARHLQQLVPGLALRIAHGKMDENMLEDAMIGFYNGDFDLLLCTTIIENGLDVPLANTIIIDGAENFGLSQLYQMRGRVGRSSRLAFAYFVYKKQRVLTEIAQKRLQAIRDFTELGAGFKIAMRDLEIRGAGNILGAEQHGHIAGIGFAAYCRLLEKTITALQTGREEEPVVLDPVVEITLDAYIPDTYIDDPRYKMEIYRKAGELVYEERNDLLDEIIDRFGDPPQEVVNLWRVASLRSLCRKLRIVGVAVRKTEIRITFDEHSLANPAALMQLVRLYAPYVVFKNNLRQPQLVAHTVGLPEEPLDWLEKALVTML